MLVDSPAALPIRRLLMKCPHSCAMIWLSIVPSRLSDAWRSICSVTGLLISAFLSAFAVASVTDRTGMVTPPPVPPSAMVPSATLSAMMMPIAPAPCAFCALVRNWQVPRSIMTILPTTCAALESPEQPSPGGAMPSTPTMSEPLTLKFCGPKPVATPAS